MGQALFQLLEALLAALGFCILFGLRRPLLAPGALGGALAWAVWLLAEGQWGGVFLPYLLAAAFGALYAELLARVLRAPATVFFAPAMIVLVPGGALYRTMSAAMQGDWTLTAARGGETLLAAIALAAGASMVWAFITFVQRLTALCRRKKQTP